MEILVLDASATCHMPDVLEMPYRPPLRNGFEAQEKAHTYRLSSNTCLTGDVIGDYSFENPVQIGDRLYFEDMAIYSFVKIIPLMVLDCQVSILWTNRETAV